MKEMLAQFVAGGGTSNSNSNYSNNPQTVATSECLVRKKPARNTAPAQLIPVSQTIVSHQQQKTTYVQGVGHFQTTGRMRDSGKPTRKEKNFRELVDRQKRLIRMQRQKQRQYDIEDHPENMTQQQLEERARLQNLNFWEKPTFIKNE
jgi:hypothetical protein